MGGGGSGKVASSQAEAQTNIYGRDYNATDKTPLYVVLAIVGAALYAGILWIAKK